MTLLKEEKKYKVETWKTILVTVQELIFADDMIRLAESEDKLLQNLLINQSEWKNINTEKSKTMLIADGERKH